ncbi:unnamed protein product, partial [Staurois parvus]
MLSLVCIAREVFFFFWGGGGACDQHRANQHFPDSCQGLCILLDQNKSSS